MRCMFDCLNGPYVVSRGTYDPIIIKSCKLFHIHMKYVHNKIFKSIIIAKYKGPSSGPGCNY